MSAQSGAELREGLSTVTRGTTFVIASTICLVLFNFLSRVLLVRSNANWGAFSFDLAVAAVLSSVGTLGLPNAIARSLPYSTSDAERRAYVRTSLTIALASGTTIAVALWLAAGPVGRYLGNPAVGLGLQFFAIAVGASIVGGLIASIFQGFADVAPNALFLQIVNPGLFLAFLGVEYYLPSIGLSYRNALVAYALANAVTLCALAVYAARRLPRHLPVGPRAAGMTGRLLDFAGPLFVAGAMVTLAGFGDTLVLGAYHNSAVATYTASLTLARLVQIGIGAASYIYLPVAARFLSRANHRAVQLTYATVTKWMAILSVPLFFLFVLLPQQSLGFVYRGSYGTVVLPLQLTVAGAFAATLLGPGAMTLIAYGRVRLLAYDALVAGLADVGLALLLVPTYGYVGAAVAWGSANVVYAALCLAQLASTDGITPFRRHFVVPLLVALVPLVLLVLPFRGLVPEWALVPIGLGVAAAFVGAVVATGSIDEGDRLLVGAVESLIGRPLPLVRRLGRWHDRRLGPR